ncbi:MAG: hypothetical protein LBK24_00050 [Puniceicoccales bacterium]|jgi:hypothetical protein|nr:hypothetical protein [Puniceicoccales bacterium]
MEYLKKIGNEQSNFESLRRKEGGIVIVFKVLPKLSEAFKEAASHVTNEQFRLAAETAGSNRHAFVSNVPLGDRMVTIDFDVSTRGVKRLNYKITFLGEGKN